MAYFRRSGPDSGLVFQVKDLDIFKVVLSSLVEGPAPNSGIGSQVDVLETFDFSLFARTQHHINYISIQGEVEQEEVHRGG